MAFSCTLSILIKKEVYKIGDTILHYQTINVLNPNYAQFLIQNFQLIQKSTHTGVTCTYSEVKKV